MALLAPGASFPFSEGFQFVSRGTNLLGPFCETHEGGHATTRFLEGFLEGSLR